MNLLELMLQQEVIWPIGMRWAVQDKDGEIKFACKAIPKPPVMEVWDRGQETSETKNYTVLSRKRAGDWRTRIIDCNEYRDAGGWMGWEGGNCPVPKEVSIKYVTRKGNTESAKAGACSWEHIDEESDIVAYRLMSIIPGQSQDKAVKELAQLYAKLGVTTLEEAFAEIDAHFPSLKKHTIVLGATVFRDCTILFRSRQMVAWVHNAEEYSSPLTEVIIDPSQDELVAYLLTGLCKAQITPVHVRQVREQVCWVYPENQ